MSGYCPVCGVYCEEDDDRVCAACKSEKKNHYCPECAAKWADEAFAAVRMVKADEIDRLTRENADLRAKLAAAEKDRDELREAVRKLGRVAAWMKVNMDEPRIAALCLQRHVDGVEKLVPLVEALNTDWIDAMNNPIAAAAVKEAGQ